MALVGALLLAACSRAPEPAIELPPLSAADYAWIGERIYRNEALGQPRYLTHWNEGEDFPSLGIGHFIWFPTGVDAPFDESFPALVEFMKTTEGAAGLPGYPDWLDELDPFDAPWRSREEFEAARDGRRMAALRDWLEATADVQARFIVASFVRRWNRLGIEGGDKASLTTLLGRLLETREGRYAVIDYYNFKGLGSNPRERYAGEGWGLVQVLGDTVAATDASTPQEDLLVAFSRAAATRLAGRVARAPAERCEARWLAGWLRRVAGYRPETATAEPFVVRPYILQVGDDHAQLRWFSREAVPGRLLVEAPGVDVPAVFVSELAPAPALVCHPSERADHGCPAPQPYRHDLRVTGLEPGVRYRYRVLQDGGEASGPLPTTAGRDGLRFVVYGDSETEPESAGEHVEWPAVGEPSRRYPVDQEQALRANLRAIAGREPDFIAIAGDLVESGGEQRDWHSFWRLHGTLAAGRPLYPAPGNHDWFGGPGEFGGYGDSRRAIAKYDSYFRIDGQERYRLVRHGPVALVVLDVNNGLPERSATDTNWWLQDVGDWQPGSPQYRWLEAALAEAQRDAAFTVVLMHHAPYSSGVHALPPGTDDGQNFSSGLPLRALSPLFVARGVDAVFSGHDELYEHSLLPGTEHLPDGRQRDHAVHFFVIGTGGDGLRGAVADADNPQRVFSADVDAPEQRDTDGRLLSGGRHYGHVEVNLAPLGDGYAVRIDPAYLLPVATPDGLRLERRVYDDVVELRVSRP